jgi:hypothetical protein
MLTASSSICVTTRISLVTVSRDSFYFFILGARALTHSKRGHTLNTTRYATTIIEDQIMGDSLKNTCDCTAESIVCSRNNDLGTTHPTTMPPIRNHTISAAFGNLNAFSLGRIISDPDDQRKAIMLSKVTLVS